MDSSPFLSDRDVLLGVVAMQRGFLNREDLLKALDSWQADPGTPLLDCLVTAGLPPAQRDALQPVVDQQLNEHAGNVEESIAAVADDNTVASLRPYLSATSDTVSEEATLPPAADEYPTVAPDAAAEPDDSTPASHSRFRVLRAHAEGGLGRVSIAFDEELQREVALKEIKEGYADDPDSRSRFTLEAEVTGGLEHPGIVPVYGLGTDAQGRPYYAMRLIKGKSLQDACEEFHEGGQRFDSLAFRELLTRFVDVCNAIAFAHSRGILHRDLKPSNIMLGKYGETLVVDWGLAKSIKRDESASREAEVTLRPAAGQATPATQVGTAMGTPAFMPPEQAAGQLDRLGPPSDVYGLGATLYYVLTKQAPFQVRDLALVLVKVQLGEFPPPRAVKRRVPKPLDAICQRAMALDPADRYPSPIELAEDLQRWLGDEPVAAYPEQATERVQRWIRRHQGLAAVLFLSAIALLATLAVTTLLVTSANRRTENALSRERSALKESELQRTNAVTALRSNRRLSARLALDRAIRLGDEQDTAAGLLWLARALDLAPEDDRDLRSLIRWNLKSWGGRLGRLEQQIPDAGFARSLAVSRDGSVLFTAKPNGVSMWDAERGRKIAELALPAAALNEDITPEGQPTFEPHKARIVLDRDEERCFLSRGKRIFAWDIATRTLRGNTLVLETDIEAIAVHPDGNRLLAGLRNGKALLVDLAQGTPVGEPLQHPRTISEVLFAADGQTIVTVCQGAQIRLWKAADASPIGAPIQGKSPFLCAVISSDGKLLATGNMFNELMVWNLETREPLDFRKKFNSYVLSLDFDPTGTSLAAGTVEGTATVWDPRTGAALGHPMLHEGGVLRLRFHPRNQSLFSVTSNLTLRSWTIPERSRQSSRLEFLDSKDLYAGKMCVHPDGEVLAIGSFRGGVQLNSVRMGKPLGTRLDFGEPVAKLTYDTNGKRLIIGGFRGAVRCYDPQDWQVVGQPLQIEGGVIDLVYREPDRILTASMKGQIQEWDLISGEPLGTPLEHIEVNHVALSGDRLASTSFSRQIVLWDLVKHRSAVDPWNHEAQPVSVAVSPGQKYVAVGDEVRSVLVFDAMQGKLLHKLRHLASVTDVDFHRSDPFVLTGSFDGGVRLWHLATGNRIGPILQHDSGVAYAGFETPDDARVVVFDSEGLLHNWDLRFADDVPDQGVRGWVESITGLSLDENGDIVVLSADDWRRRTKKD